MGEKRKEKKVGEDNEGRRYVAKTTSSLNGDIEGWTSREARIPPLSHIAVIRDICLAVLRQKHFGGIISASRPSSDECRDLIDMDD